MILYLIQIFLIEYPLIKTHRLLIAFKITRRIKQKRKAKKGYMTLKLEQRLRIEWEWLFVET